MTTQTTTPRSVASGETAERYARRMATPSPIPTPSPTPVPSAPPTSHPIPSPSATTTSTAEPSTTGAPVLPADWSQFFPDLLGGLIVAVAVGIVLYRWQRVTEARSRARSAELGWWMARTRVAQATSVPISRKSGARSFTNYSDQFVRIVEVSSTYPVAQWTHDSPKNLELGALAAIVTIGPAIQRLGQDLGAGLREHFRASFGNQYSDYEKLAMARVLEVDEAQLDQLTQVNNAASYMVNIDPVLASEDFASDVAELKGLIRLAEGHYLYLSTMLERKRSAPVLTTPMRVIYSEIQFEQLFTCALAAWPQLPLRGISSASCV